MKCVHFHVCPHCGEDRKVITVDVDRAEPSRCSSCKQCVGIEDVRRVFKEFFSGMKPVPAA